MCLRPYPAYRRYYAKAKSRDKGIQKILAGYNIEYVSFVKLGNPFMECDDWRDRYRQYLEKEGDHLIEPLRSIPGPFCLLCSEKSSEECHRFLIAEYLVSRGYEAEHIE